VVKLRTRKTSCILVLLLLLLGSWFLFIRVNDTSTSSSLVRFVVGGVAILLPSLSSLAYFYFRENL
jgi:hypothetical protein